MVSHCNRYHLCGKSDSDSSHPDVATDNLLDIEDSVNVVAETNGNAEEDQLDNHRPPETNNNPTWVRFSFFFQSHSTSRDAPWLEILSDFDHCVTDIKTQWEQRGSSFLRRNSFALIGWVLRWHAWRPLCFYFKNFRHIISPKREILYLISASWLLCFFVHMDINTSFHFHTAVKTEQLLCEK